MTYEQEIRAALGTFVVEGGELMADMESMLLGLDGTGDHAEEVNAIFRAAHTIKGSAGLFRLDHIVRFTHTVETVLERLRSGEIAVTPELVGVLLPCCDHIAELVEAVGQGATEATESQDSASDDLLGLLQPYLTGASAPVTTGSAGAPAASPDVERDHHLSLRFGRECLRNGMDPLAFIGYLATLGTILDLHIIDGLLPELGDLDPECCHLGFEIDFRSAEEVETIVEAFEFIRDESIIHVFTPGPSPQEREDLIESYGPAAEQVAMVLSNVPAGGEPPEIDRLTAATVPTGLTALPVPAAPRSASTAVAAPPAARADEATRNIRVDAARLDRLIDLVGELVVAGATASVQSAGTDPAARTEAVDEVMRLVEQVRDGALQLRMVPIGTTLSRFQRVVRDVASDLGKEVALVITGGETEVDKALVERIGDPLTHLVRNALDHGLETPQVRVANGKPARGTLHLNAFHDSGSIVIEVTDDGAGIDRDRILGKAIERGLVGAGTVLSDTEVFELIFEPGFSTADQVSDLSGRGVGMDVVKRNVRDLRGTVEVSSVPGLGATIRVRLPLTLAIIDGFLINAGSTAFVIPLDRVVECVALPPLASTRDCMDLRGEVLPFIRLRSMFALDGEPPRRENVVVVESAGVKIGLIVDTLMGEFQTVIKPLGPLFEHVRGISGSTILGTGDVALILDVSTLVQHHGNRDESRYLVGAAQQ